MCDRIRGNPDLRARAAMPGISPERYMNYEVTRQILWNVPLASSARPGAGCFNHGIVEAAGVFGFPYYLLTMMEVR